MMRLIMILRNLMTELNIDYQGRKSCKKNKLTLIHSVSHTDYPQASVGNLLIKDNINIVNLFYKDFIVFYRLLINGD